MKVGPTKAASVVSRDKILGVLVQKTVEGRSFGVVPRPIERFEMRPACSSQRGIQPPVDGQLC